MTTTRLRTLRRRTLLRGAGGVALALPLLEAMLPRGARAATARPKKLVTVFSPNGIVPTTYWPTVDASGGFTIPAGGILEPLAAHKGDLVIFKGLRNKAAAEMPVPASHPEGVFTMLTGRAPAGVQGQNFGAWRPRGASIDQVIAAGPLGRTLHPTLGVGPDGVGWVGTLSFDRTHQPVPHHTSPKTVFRLLFADPAATPAQKAQLLDRRRSVLDGVREGCARLAARLGAEDRRRMEAHCTKVRELEDSLALAVAPVCATPPAALGTTDYQDINTKYDELPRLIDVFSQLLVLALACDLTNLATFVLKRSGGGSYYASFLGPDFANSSGIHEIHEMSHRVGQPAWDPKLTLIARFFMTQLATFVDRLKAHKRPDGGSLFDDVVVLHGSEVGTGDHNKENMPFFLVGGAGIWKTGRVLTYDRVPHNKLLVSLLQGFGVADPAAFEDPTNAGPLAGF